MLSPELELDRVANTLLPDLNMEKFKIKDEKLYITIIEAMKLYGELRYSEGVHDATNAAIEIMRNHDGEF
jgi:hypothetical protein